MSTKLEEIFDKFVLVFIIAAMLKEFVSGNTSVDIFILGISLRLYIEVFFEKKK